MKVFLRHERTGHYYCGNCEWVTELDDANHFQTIEQAQQAINQDKLDGMSLVMIHDESELRRPSIRVARFHS
jgi:hypothetical protein